MHASPKLTSPVAVCQFVQVAEHRHALAQLGGSAEILLRIVVECVRARFPSRTRPSLLRFLFLR